MTAGARPAVILVPAPIRRGSISGGRFDLAPAAVLAALDRFVAHGPGEPGRLDELGVAVERGEAAPEAADLAPGEAFEPIRGDVSAALAGGPDRVAIVLGGDNSITRAGVHAVAPDGLARAGLLTLDAHHDLRDTAEGLTNGNPVRALLEDGLPGPHVAQLGIQPLANAPALAAVARDAGIAVRTADEVRRRGIEEATRAALDALADRCDAIYVDLDLDVLDRAFAPACPGSRPGGLTPAELLIAAEVCGAHPSVRAADVVEVDPERDIAGTTVLAAAACVLSFTRGVAMRTGTHPDRVTR